MSGNGMTGVRLRALTALEVIEVMRQGAGLSLEAYAEMLGRDRQTVGGWFSPAANRFIPVALVPGFCAASGSGLLIEWLWAKYHEAIGTAAPENTPCRPSPERAADELLRAVSMASALAVKLRDRARRPRDLTPEQVSRLADEGLAALGRMAAGIASLRGAPEAPARPRFLRAPVPAKRPGWWARLRRWLWGDPARYGWRNPDTGETEWFVSLDAVETRRAQWEQGRRCVTVSRGGRDLPGLWTYEEAQRLCGLPPEPVPSQRLAGAMGHILREMLAADKVPDEFRGTAARLLRDGAEAAHG